MPFYDLVLEQKKKNQRSVMTSMKTERQKSKNGRKMLTHYR